jgi:Flp pilus assembly protein TadG
MTLRTLRKLLSFLPDQRGAAAVEMALVTPFLAIIVAGIATYAPELDRVHKMHSAVSTAALYVMTGGTNPTSIQDVALSAWTGRTEGDTISVTQWCACGSSANVCTSLCADSTVPLGYTSITAAATYVGPMGSQSLSTVQTVRTR